MLNIRTFILVSVIIAGLGSVAGMTPAAAQSANAAGDRSSEQNSSVSYDVSIDVATEHFKVGGVLVNIPRDTITFHFPVWGPGAYDIVNFGAYVQNFTATSGTGRKLQVLRSDTNTFKIIGGDARVHITYDVDDIESVPNSLWFGLSDVEQDYAFANTPAIFGYPDGFKDVPYTVTYNVPQGWRIAIGLDPVDKAGAATDGPQRYHARDYDELVDAPISMGALQMLEFSVKGKPHIIAVHSPARLDSAAQHQLVDMTRRVVEIVSDVFGDMPYDRYVFQHYLVRPTPGDFFFGALEHRNSSTYRMPAPGGLGGESVAEILKTVVAHEYWHLWSPKRIHVDELGPFDYQRGPRTNSLWFAEGLTEYYAQVLLARNGLSDPRDVIGSLNQAVMLSNGRRQTMSIAELSLKITELPTSEILGLYTKGPILGLLLDASIRSQTGNSKSLDDAMRYFNDEYGKTGRTFTDEEIIPIMERATGAKLEEFHRRYIVGTEPLPFAEYLPKMGLKLEMETKKRRTFGAELESSEQGWRVAAVNPGESAEMMGLRPGDVVTAIRYRNSTIETSTVPATYADAVATMRDVVGFDVLRGDATQNVAAKIVEGTSMTARAGLDDNASPEAKAIRKAMIGI